ncbi:hypothetical protein C2S53_007331 [Perilla frutescens var. hirtella]|uniref:Plus3 domain-containing protein n=1 Tax=Perilla frutescens var. hirtella TaxID=608512 RepID=A0AAD4NXA9_PERFH|nr:hypothetical protein C2S53_007331 [Perilla frutescens var. hirtella]
MVNLHKLLLAAAKRLATTEEGVHLSPPNHTCRRRRVSFDDDVKDNDRSESSKKTSTSHWQCDDSRSRRGCIEDSDDEIVGDVMLEAFATEEEFGPSKVHVRASCTKAERAGALAELVKRRTDASRRGSSCQCSSVNKIDAPPSNVGNSNLTSCNEEESSWEEMSSSDEDNETPEPPTLQEVMGITVPRSKLVQWYMEPFFNELIIGCFVRILIGKGEEEVPVYRLCQVLNVDATNPDRQYEFESKTTCKYLNLVWGNGSPATWQMAVVSNSPPRKLEFDQWLREVKLTEGRIPTKQELLEKRQALEKVNSFIYSAAATVKQVVEEKRPARWKPASIAAEKAHLRRELELARDDDELELKRIRARMHELETIRDSSRGSRKKARMVEELSKKNLLVNLINSSSKTVRAKSSL